MALSLLTTTGASDAGTVKRPARITLGVSIGSSPKFPQKKSILTRATLSNRVRPVGVVEKCTYCLHRTRRGKLPACLEACPTGARVFGNILDKNSNIRWILENKRVYILKEELGTKPAFFYYFD